MDKNAFSLCNQENITLHSLSAKLKKRKLIIPLCLLTNCVGFSFCPLFNFVRSHFSRKLIYEKNEAEQVSKYYCSQRRWNEFIFFEHDIGRLLSKTGSQHEVEFGCSRSEPITHEVLRKERKARARQSSRVEQSGWDSCRVGFQIVSCTSRYLILQWS